MIHNGKHIPCNKEIHKEDEMHPSSSRELQTSLGEPSQVMMNNLMSPDVCQQTEASESSKPYIIAIKIEEDE